MEGEKHILIVCLIILVPLVPGVHAVEVPRLARAVLVFPVVGRGVRDVLFDIEQLFLFVQLALRLGSVERLGSEVGAEVSKLVQERSDLKEARAAAKAAA